VLFLFFEPNVGAWHQALEIAAFTYIFSIGGLGALLALLTRAGVVEFVYSDADKDTFEYKMAKMVAERERHNSLGAKFSERYFQSFDIEKNDSAETVSARPPEGVTKLLSLLPKIVGIAFIVGGVIFFAVGLALLFVHADNTKLIGVVFIGGSIVNIVLGVVAVRFWQKI